MYREKLESALAHRRKQFGLMQSWLGSHDGYVMQVNICMPKSDEHVCVTINRDLSKKLSVQIMDALAEQIKNIEGQL